MAKYIDADLLITHINQRIKEHNKSIRQNKQTTKSDIVDAMLVSGRDTYEALLHFIKKNQQEQLDADLDKEIKNYFKGFYMDCTDQGYILKDSDGSVGLMSVKEIARHFFELGLKAGRKA